MTIRFHLPPGGDVPPVVAARRMGLSLDSFNAAIEELASRGFPPADPTTGNNCLEAIDAWRTRARYPQMFGLTGPQAALNARDVVPARLARLRGG
jgi:hypothetical protein